MISRKIILKLILCLFILKGYSQDSILVLGKTIPYKTVSFSVNNIGELFLINQDNQLKKIDNKGDSVGVFNEIGKYGMLTYAEARNPWRALLFYQDFANIVLLDKYLNVVTNINLRQHNLFRVKAVGTSYDNNIWLFDEQDFKLKKLDESGNILLESVDLRQLFNEELSPDILKDRDGAVYLYDHKKGLYIFDYFGSFRNKMAFTNWKNFEVAGKHIYGFDDKNIYSYQSGTLNVDHYALPESIQFYSSIQLIHNKIYILKNGIVQQYQLNK